MLRFFINLFTLGIFILSIYGCSYQKPKEYKIAVVVDKSGETAEIGKAVIAGVKYAETSLLKNSKLQIVTFDDQNNPKIARKIAMEIAADSQYIAVIGNASSGITSVSEDVYGRFNVPFILPVATKPSITTTAKEKGFNNILRIVPTHDLQAYKMVDFAKYRLNAKRVLVVNDASEYGLDLGQIIEKAFQSRGVTVLLHQQIANVKREGTDYSAMVANIRQYKTDLVTFAGYYSEASYLVKQIRGAGIKVPILLTDGCFQMKLFENMGNNSDSVYVAFIAPDWQSLPETKELVKKVSVEYENYDPSYAPFAYDAIGLVLRAISLREKEISRKNILEVIRNPQFEYKGLAGHYQFNNNGDWSSGSNYIYKVIAKSKKFEYFH